MTIAVAFTEYQLIQIQSLISYYGLQNVELITFKKNRIPNWLIDHDKYRRTLYLPEVNISRYKRLGKPFIDEYYQLIKDFIGDKKITRLIGAQDENTIYSIVKLLAAPSEYWSIEDGLANYYKRKLTFKMGIFFKRLLFNTVYGYHLGIAYGHGKIQSDKSFRMLPSMCVDNGNHIASGQFVKAYLTEKSKKVNHLLDHVSEKYGDKEELVVTNINKVTENKICQNHCLYKLHPNDIISENLEIDYIKDVIPIEILVMYMKGLKYVRFDSISSSIVNLLSIYNDLDIKINFNYENKTKRRFLEKLFTLYPERLSIYKNIYN